MFLIHQAKVSGILRTFSLQPPQRLYIQYYMHKMMNYPRFYCLLGSFYIQPKGTPDKKYSHKFTQDNIDHEQVYFKHDGGGLKEILLSFKVRLKEFFFVQLQDCLVFMRGIPNMFAIYISQRPSACGRDLYEFGTCSMCDQKGQSVPGVCVRAMDLI